MAVLVHMQQPFTALVILLKYLPLKIETIDLRNFFMHSTLVDSTAQILVVVIIRVIVFELTITK